MAFFRLENPTFFNKCQSNFGGASTFIGFINILLEVPPKAITNIQLQP